MSIENNKKDFEEALSELENHREDMADLLGEEILSSLDKVFHEYNYNYIDDIESAISEIESLKDNIAALESDIEDLESELEELQES